MMMGEGPACVRHAGVVVGSLSVADGQRRGSLRRPDNFTSRQVVCRDEQRTVPVRLLSTVGYSCPFN